MEQSLHFITVSTADLDAARSFYITGLGWSPMLDVPGEIIFFQVAPGLVLGLFESETPEAPASEKKPEDEGGLRIELADVRIAHGKAGGRSPGRDDRRTSR